MTSLKHFGRVKNTGRRCVVVFREIYDERGHVTDTDNCLIFETENLPDAEQQELMGIVQGENAQSTGDVFNVLARARLGNGMAALTWLASSQRLKKFPTSNIELTPDSNTTLSLNTLNTIVKMQKAGASEATINKILRDDADLSLRNADDVAASLHDANSAQVETQTADGGLDNDALAQQRLTQAELFETQAMELREQAYSLNPALKPKRMRRAAPKKSTAN